MDHYQDIKILPDPEFPSPMLMNALFAKLHRALVQLGTNSIGVSFPKVDEEKPSLGNVLRLHGNAVELKNLHEMHWLVGMRDHIALKEILPVPDRTQHCRVKRKQVDSSAERLRKRYCKRHPGVTESDVVGLIPESVEKRLTLPYLQLKSESTGQRFRLFLQHQQSQPEPISGIFNAYGLSDRATVPWF
jgi:CRISPR-associated endonuclease Csy4